MLRKPFLSFFLLSFVLSPVPVSLSPSGPHFLLTLAAAVDPGLFLWRILLSFFSSTCDASFGRLGLTNLPLGMLQTFSSVHFLSFLVDAWIGFFMTAAFT